MDGKVGPTVASAAQGRVLVRVPIVHSPEDMGSLGDRLGSSRDYTRVAGANWAEIRWRVQGLGLNWSQVRIYQDGLPDTEKRLIEKILAEVQSPNYELLRWLVAQGAELLGTESASLLKEEYDLVRNVLMSKDDVAREQARDAYAGRAAELLQQRDRYIALRIEETLRPGDIGILFIGRVHQVRGYLAPDILVRDLDVSPST